jgi:hypothetical protein
MKKILTLCIAACCSTAVMAQSDSQPYLTKPLAGNAINNVVVSTLAGGILVSGADGQAPRIEVYIKGQNDHKLSAEEIQKRLAADYDMKIEVNGHELDATVKNKHDNTDWKNGLTISFKIYVPREVSTNLRTSGGGIQLDNLKGNENFTTSGGGIAIDKLTGTIKGRTSGGGIQVSDSGSDIDLQTSGGGITADNCTGNIKLVTSGGGIALNHLDGSITAHTSGGGIAGKHINGELITGTSGGGIDLKDMDCALDAVTSAGSVNVEMNHVGKYLKLNTSAGNIALKLPAKQGYDLNLTADKINDQVAGNFNGTWTKNNVNGTVNGGGIAVDAHASSNMSVSFN